MEQIKLTIFEEEKAKYVLENKITSLTSKDYLCGDIIKNKNLFNYSISINEEEKKTNIDDLFMLRINVKDVGLFVFFYQIDDFNKDEYIEKISELKQIEIKDFDSAKNKINSLLTILNPTNYLFSFYNGDGEYHLKPEDFEEFTINNLIFVTQKEKKVETKEKTEEVCIKDNLNKAKNRVTKEMFLYPFKLILEEKYHFVFVLISSFLISFDLTIAVCNIYLTNLIYILFIICALIGIGLSGYVFYSLYSNGKKNVSMTILSAVIGIVGLGLGIAGFAIYYAASKDLPSTLPSQGHIILIGLVGSLLAFIFSVLFPYLLTLFFKRKKKM